MYIDIDGTEYAELRSLRFSPETDVSGGTVPVNELQVDVMTADDIPAGGRLTLYGGDGALWAKYWVAKADRKDAETVHVTAQSAVKQLERDMLGATMYSATLVTDVLPVVLARLDGEWELDASFTGKTITGYCPNQSARNRFQLICLAIGAYVTHFFNDKLQILPIETAVTPIYESRIYWRPEVTYGDYVTRVEAHWYEYEEREPTTTESYVEVGTKGESDYHVYVQTDHQLSLANTDVPAGTLEHAVVIDGDTLINQDNVSDVLSHAASVYFKRTGVTFDAIDNGDLIPGQLVSVPIAAASVAVGHVRSCDFTFGQQARARVEVEAADEVDAARVNVSYTWDSLVVGQRMFLLPVGYAYDIPTEWLDVTFGGHRYVFAPSAASVSGTVAEGGNSHTVSVDVALDYAGGDLLVAGVDEATLADSELEIG